MNRLERYFRASAQRFILKLLKLLRLTGRKSKLNIFPQTLVVKFHNGFIAILIFPIRPVRI